MHFLLNGFIREVTVRTSKSINNVYAILMTNKFQVGHNVWLTGILTAGP